MKKRTVRFELLMTEEDRQALEALAKADGTSMAKVVSKLVQASAKRRKLL